MREMCGKKEEGTPVFQNYQEQLFQQQLEVNRHEQPPDHLHQSSHGELLYAEPSSILSWSLPPVHSNFSPVQILSNSVGDHHDHFFTPPPSSYGGMLFGRRPSGLQLAYEAATADHFGLAGLYVSEHLGPASRASSSPFAFQSELSRMTAQEIMDAKALSASKSHSEAERRRRERINNHLARLRGLLPSTTKTDKASLLAEVIQHVKDLKRQTSEITEFEPLPTEVDELIVDQADENGKVVIRASLCCEDRSDLLPDLIKALKALRLRTLKAEITTLGGRVKNVLVITGEEDSCNSNEHSITSIQEALKAVMERTASDESSSGSVKRQRTNVSILERRSV